MADAIVEMFKRRFFYIYQSINQSIYLSIKFNKFDIGKYNFSNKLIDKWN